MKKLILIIFAVSYSSFSFAQESVDYEIVRNNPKDLNNLIFVINPINFDYLSTYFNFSYSIGAEYNHKDKFTLGFDFKRAYTEKWNLFEYDNKNDFGSDIIFGSAAEKVKNMTQFELNGQVLIAGKVRNKHDRVVVDDGLSITTYIKVKSKQFTAFPFRASYGYRQYNSSTQGIRNDNYFYYQGYNIYSSPIKVEPISGSTMYFLHYLSFGTGFYQKQDMKINIGGHGTRDYSILTIYYIDFILPISQELQNMNVEEQMGNTIKKYEVNVNDNTDMTSYGIRAGMKFQNILKGRKVNVGGMGEVGFMPGPGIVDNNIFVSIGLSLNLSFQTAKN